MHALNDKAIFQSYKKLINETRQGGESINKTRLQNDIDVLKLMLEKLIKVRTYGNIQTPDEYETIELERMKNHIEELEQQI